MAGILGVEGWIGFVYYVAAQLVVCPSFPSPVCVPAAKLSARETA